MSEKADNVLFPAISADDDQPDVTELESLCLRCEEQGTTRLMLTKIPFFKEVIVSSFSCDQCGSSDTGIQSAGKIQEKGIKLTLTVTDKKDLNRQVVKADCASFAIPSLEFEQPPINRKGEITTIEGLIDGVVTGLELMQPERREIDEAIAEKIDAFIQKLKQLKAVESSFEVVINDPTGNSFIENFNAPNPDKYLKIEHYQRTKEMNVELGLSNEDEPEQTETQECQHEEENLKDEVMVFKTNCSNCNVPCDTNMKLVDIPFFKQVIIMATVCDACGVKDNEVKCATGIEDKGTKITLKITDPTDLSRDVLKSDTCGVIIPELDLELVEGTLGGKFTTLEGLIENIIDNLSSAGPASIGMVGDSTDTSRRNKMNDLLENLRQISKGVRLGDHFILNDPAGNSYLQNVYAPEADPEMTIEHYERNYEQNEILGLNDMKTENYEQDNTEAKNS